jgi:hypothetical protein
MKWATLFGVIVGILGVSLLVDGNATSATAWDSLQNQQVVTNRQADQKTRLQKAVQVMFNQARAQHAALNKWHKVHQTQNMKAASTSPVRKAGTSLAMEVSR